MLSKRALSWCAWCPLLVVACIGGCSEDETTPPTARGTLIDDQRVLTLDAPSLVARLSATTAGQGLLAVAGAPTCGVDVQYFRYWTVGGAGESTTASGAIMLPSGGAAQCASPHPMVLYAHGTDTNKALNLANLADPSNDEGRMIAAMFAAQGFIVVAPNYAGYDVSTLPYHPYLDAEQQSKDMMDAMTAAESVIPPGMLNGKLFVTGYSEGGFVAMATHKALQEAGVAVVASAPMSGPYALEAFGDAIAYGNVNLGSTVFLPLITTSYQHAYGNIYRETTDIYDVRYAQGIDTLLPSTTPIATIFQEGLLPTTALFDSDTPQTGNATLDKALAVPSNPLFALGFGKPGLVTNDFRFSYAFDAAMNPDGAVPTPQPGVPLSSTTQNPLRAALRRNDLRSWAPDAPLLLCGGNADPTVFFGVNTGTMATFWSSLPAGRVTVLDVDSEGGSNDPFAAVKQGFQQQKSAVQHSQGEQAVTSSYHVLVAPFCTVAARTFFSQL